MVLLLISFPVSGFLIEIFAEANSQDYEFAAEIIQSDLYSHKIKEQTKKALLDRKLSEYEVAGIRNSIRKEEINSYQNKEKQKLEESKKKALELMEK